MILGGDGYIGWPLTMKIALSHPGHKIIVMDSEWRRTATRKLTGGNTFVIAHPAERLKCFSDLYQQNNILYIKSDINSRKLEDIIKSEKPSVIFHLAQQPSAPYSMMGQDEAIFTLQNNESGNLKLLWNVQQFVPDAHIIKLGSFGQYAKSAIDIPEGYFLPEYNGKKADRRLPFPREADDVYHISKINDTNYVSMACRKWHLRVTDVMQSTVFGLQTPEMAGNPTLFTRFDYDDCFGTVANRFVAQAVAGYPLTVYGTGEQRTGLMSLRDVVTSLARLVNHPATAGEHRVVNHVTETQFTINELAHAIQKVAAQRNLNVGISHLEDRRGEAVTKRQEYAIVTDTVDDYLTRSAFDDVINETMEVLVNSGSPVNIALFKPRISWKGESPGSLPVTDTASNELPEFKDIYDDAYWEAFRKVYFPANRINLNPGTLGTTSVPVRRSRALIEDHENLSGYPLGIYEKATHGIEDVIKLAAEIWPLKEFEIVVTPSITQIVNLLSINMLRKFYKSGDVPFPVVTTRHEHSGGIGCFHQLSEYQVHYLDDTIWNSDILLESTLSGIQPKVILLSHIRYDTGRVMDIESWCNTIKKTLPDCVIIIDIAQSMGLSPLPDCQADIILSSTHKWLFGPHGGGIMWIRQSCARWLEGIFWDVIQNTTTVHIGSFQPHGGQDFFLYSGIFEALNLYNQTGVETVATRSKYLGQQTENRLREILDKYPLSYEILNPEGGSPIVSIGFTEYDPYPLYQYLNDRGIHIKCIKNQYFGERVLHIIRLGLPYFETMDRINYTLTEIDIFLTDAFKNARA